tara:strand:+ start:227 stop:1258 length:1032 start_codon:yes stop_codon:yes gene_type:complete
MNNSKILISGGAGFVGSNLTIQLLKQFNPKKIIVVDNLLSSEASNIISDPKVSFIFGSIADDKILKRLPTDLDYVFHLSCYHGNQSSIANPLDDHENNSLTSLKLFNWLSSLKTLKKIVYAAAGCAVAEKKYGRVSATFEESPVSLYHDSPYSISKLIGEMYGNYFFKHKNLPFVKARFQNIYGPREFLGAGIWRGTIHTVWRNVIPTFIWKAINNEELLLDNEGLTSRDFIYVDDIVKGLILCAQKGLNGDAYNLASGVETRIIDIANSILEITNSKSKIKLMPKRIWDNSGNRFGSTEKSNVELGFKSEINLISGLRNTISWTKKNRIFISSLINKHKIHF